MGSFFNEEDGAGIPSMLADRVFRTSGSKSSTKGTSESRKENERPMMLFIGEPT